MRNTDLGISSEQIDGFYLNLQFKNNALLCTTGTSLKTFLMTKQPEQFWDDMILHFLNQNQILFEKLWSVLFFHFSQIICKHINKLTIGRLVFQRISRDLIQKTFISFPADIDQCSDIVFYIRRSRFIFCCQTWINIFCDMHRLYTDAAWKSSQLLLQRNTPYILKSLQVFWSVHIFFSYIFPPFCAFSFLGKYPHI